MTTKSVLSVILAAGKGTRMKSDLPKPLHQVAGRTLLAHAMAVSAAANHQSTAVVVGPGMDNVGAEAERQKPGTRIFIQDNQKAAPPMQCSLPALH